MDGRINHPGPGQYFNQQALPYQQQPPLYPTPHGAQPSMMTMMGAQVPYPVGTGIFPGAQLMGQPQQDVESLVAIVGTLRQRNEALQNQLQREREAHTAELQKERGDHSVTKNALSQAEDAALNEKRRTLPRRLWEDAKRNFMGKVRGQRFFRDDEFECLYEAKILPECSKPEYGPCTRPECADWPATLMLAPNVAAAVDPKEAYRLESMCSFDELCEPIHEPLSAKERREGVPLPKNASKNFKGMMASVAKLEGVTLME